MKQFCRLLIGIIIVLSLAGQRVLSAKVYQANGIKIGEVTSSTAIIWTRLTKFSERNVDGVSFPTVPWQKVAVAGGKETYLYQKQQIPRGYTLDQMQDVVLGTVGEIRIAYWSKKRPQDKAFLSWTKVNPNHDFTHQFQLTGLGAGTTYQLELQCRADSILGHTIFGNFTTAPEPSVSDLVIFTVVTGQGFHRRDDPANGHRIYLVMQGLNPDFFVHTGDIVYYDKLAPVALTTDLARLKWNRIYALPFQRDFHNHVASYFIKDDHDVWQNDCWPTKQNKRMGDFTFKQGQQIFLEQVPMGMQTYRTMRWGKDLQIWLVEGRDFRSPNSIPDGPDKTIWGNQQKTWFKRTVIDSYATFRILISPTPVVGPDREKKNDNHANEGFKHEGDELRHFMGQQKNMVVICGDRHWQYVSVDPITGLREYSCGPTSNHHAGGFKREYQQPMHRYLNICGGFLSATVERVNEQPLLTIRHHSVTGEILNQDQLTAE